LAQVW
jgi:hypothetical protein